MLVAALSCCCRESAATSTHLRVISRHTYFFGTALLANIALHGLERHLKHLCPKATIVRYADDFVILCTTMEEVSKLRKASETWLAEMGLRLKESKTRFTHTLNEYEGEKAGFDFLGFTVRQFPHGKYQTYTYRGKEGFKTFTRPSAKGQQRHAEKLKTVINEQEASQQDGLIQTLNPQITGWANYYRTAAAKRIFARMDKQLDHRLTLWTAQRHPQKCYRWRRNRYWHFDKGSNRF